MTNLSHLNIGDHVAIPCRDSISFRHQPIISHLIYKITGRTKTQFKVANTNNPMQIKTIRIADGALIGERTSVYVRAEPAPPEILAQHEAQKAALIRFRQAQAGLQGLIGKELHQLSLTVEQMEHLGKAWAEVKAMATTTKPT